MSELQHIVYFNGAYIPEVEALIPAGARAVGYGEGVFDSLLIEDNFVFLIEKHLQRFNKACQILVQGSKELNLKTFIQILENLCDKNSWYNGNARIRIQAGVFNTAGYPLTEKRLFLLISMIPFQRESKSVRLTFSDFTKIPKGCFPGGMKWSQYLQNMLALKDAKSKGFDDAILLTSDEFVSETSISNIFWIKNNEILTPAESTGMLPGIMREVILELIQGLGIKVNIGEFSKTSLLQADAVFITNSVKRIAEVEHLDSINFEINHPIVVKLKDLLVNYILANRCRL